MSAVAEFAAHLGLVPDEASFKRGDKLLEGLKHGLEVLGVAETISKIKEMVSSTVEAAVAAKELAQKVGLSTEAVQELGYAASVTGGSGEGMQVSMQHLARGLQELRTKGTGPAADGLKALKVNVHDAEIQHGNLDQVLEIVADRFAKMPDGVEKTAVAMDLFGRSGTELLPLLNKGASGIKELRDEAERLGVVIGDEGIEKAHEFELAQKRLGATLTGLKNEAVIALLPALQEMVEGLSAWVGENREAIASTLEAVIHGVADAFRVVGEVVKSVTEFFHEHGDVAMAVITALGSTIAAFAISAAIDWVIAFAPFIEIIAILTAVILVVKDLWESIEHGQGVFADIGRALEDWVVGVEEKFQAMWDYITNGFHQLWEDVKSIPILGDIISAGADLAGYLSSPGVQGGFGDSLANPATIAASYGGGGARGGDVHNTFGAVSVEVNAADIDKNNLEGFVGDIVVQKQKEMIKQSYDADKGGHR